MCVYTSVGCVYKCWTCVYIHVSKGCVYLCKCGCGVCVSVCGVCGGGRMCVSVCVWMTFYLNPCSCKIAYINSFVAKCLVRRGLASDESRGGPLRPLRKYSTRGSPCSCLT